MTESKNVVIALTSTGHVSSNVAAGLAFTFGTLLVSGIPTSIMVSDMMDVASARRMLVETALNKGDATHIMWLDSDILVEPEGVLRLIRSDKRVIGGLYRRRSFPCDPLVFDLTDKGFVQKRDFNPTGVNQVGGMGQGCLLVDLSVYREMSEHFGDDHWYVFGPDLGEDFWFFKRLAEMGIPVYLDATVRCGHEATRVIAVEDNWVPHVLSDGR
jgi:hypothetical protein